jgi:hypothetical protein
MTSVCYHGTLTRWAFAVLLTTKLIAFNLLPIPGLSGFAIPYRTLGIGIVPPPAARVAGPIATLGSVGGWAWAVIAYATS